MTGRGRRFRRRSLEILTVLVGIAGVAACAWFLTPWPKALLIRAASDKGGWQTNRELARFVKPGITVVHDIRYRSGDKDAKLDVYFPKATRGVLPTIVWTHGGGFVSGSKEQESNYYRILANQGFVVVGISYSLAPEKNYPVPVRQLNAALGFLRNHATKYHIARNDLFLAGDSAGSQIAAQEATILTSPSYARRLGIDPVVPSFSIAGAILNCGPYDLNLARKSSSQYGQFMKIVLWSYLGKKDFLDDKDLASASVTDYVGKHFPPAFITAGNGDPLESQSKALAAKLVSVGDEVDTKFFTNNYRPAQPHEYQFFLWTSEGMDAFHRMVKFVEARSSNQTRN
jgi:acetyl esterase